MRKESKGKNKGQACFIDLQKAFDKLDNEIIMIKLEKYCFEETILQSLRKYFSDRYQFVCENEKPKYSVLKLVFPRAVY